MAEKMEVKTEGKTEGKTDYQSNEDEKLKRRRRNDLYDEIEDLYDEIEDGIFIFFQEVDGDE